MKSFFANAFAFIYFSVLMLPMLLMIFIIHLIFLSDVSTIRSSGFSGPSSGFVIVGLCGFIIGLSLLIPPLRIIYRVLPWLFPLVQIGFINIVILEIALIILNFGYEVDNEVRHTTFYILMIVQIVICRLAMSVFYKYKPLRFEGRGTTSGQTTTGHF